MDDQEQGEALEQLLTVADVARMFSVTSATVREWLVSGELRGIKIGRGYYWRVPVSAAAEYANKRYGDNRE